MTTHSSPTNSRQVTGLVLGLTAALTVILVAFAGPPPS